MADGDDGVHVAPRLTFLLPTGDEHHGRGAGGLGIQTNLPFSVRPRSWLALHANAGLTWTPDAKNAADESAATLSANLGGSAIWLLRPRLNLMLELLWLSTEQVDRAGSARRDGRAASQPRRSLGVQLSRADSRSSPAWPIRSASTTATGADALFLYLSFEHPFRH